MLDSGDRLTPGGAKGDVPLEVPVTSRSSVVQTKVRIPQAPSMPVERLDALLDAAHDHRLALIVAPAGSGKTTLLARFAARAAGVVGWYRAEGWDRDEGSLLRHIEAALIRQLPGVSGNWRTVTDAVNALDAWRAGRVLILIDDLHTLEGTPAEEALGRLIDYAPATLTVVAASRVPPGFNLPRLRVSGALAEITSDDLRLRSWEVERLFRDFYGEPLPPEELARLARRTEGWAAGLQLFHLATRGRAANERQRVLAELGPRSRLMRDYLTRNVLDQLPAELRRFLIETSVLGRLSAPLCNSLLGGSGSAAMLAELLRRNLFTQAMPEDGVYRYHEVLRSCLQGVLLEEVGEEQTRARFRRAGQLLAQADALPEALEAFCRAEDWRATQILLGSEGHQLAVGSSAWLDALPPTLLRHDPWLLLASARRTRADGRFADAVRRYQQAEQAFAGSEPAHTCRDEASAISAWLDAERTAPPGSWVSLLRAALVREPRLVAGDPTTQETESGRLVAGLAYLLAGNVRQAQPQLVRLAEDEHVSAAVRAMAATASAIGGLLAGQPQAGLALEGAAASAEGLGLDWLARLGRAGLAISGTDESLNEARGVAGACASAGDRWGAALSKLFAAWGSLGRQQEDDQLDALVADFRALGAPVLEAWARAMSAFSLAHAGGLDAAEAARSAEASARLTGVPAARMLSYLALAESATQDGGAAAEYSELAADIAHESSLSVPMVSGLAVPTAEPLSERRLERRSSAIAAPVPPLRIRLFGQFEFELAGQLLDTSTVRPRVRSLLRLLSLHADQAVHHETIEAALWPEAEAAVASRNLHVAVATLRRVLEPSSARGGFRLIRREGDGYLVSVPHGGVVDLRRFESALETGRAARERGRDEVARDAFGAALREYRGELLPEEGPAEWLAERRENARLAAVEAAQGLAELMLAAGDPRAAARICARGLGIERYHDPLWRLLIDARERAGDQGAASRARQGYQQMLRELGLDFAGQVAADQRREVNSTSRRATSGSPPSRSG